MSVPEITDEIRAAVHREDAVRECVASGHDYEHIVGWPDTLVAVICARCAKRYNVTEVL